MWSLWKNVIEDEKHFIYLCLFYNDLRNSLYSKINYTQPEFQSMLVYDNVVYWLNSAFPKRRQKYITNI